MKSWTEAEPGKDTISSFAALSWNTATWVEVMIEFIVRTRTEWYGGLGHFPRL